jgi:uncharacterized iron-regulated membrane protein
LRWSRTAYATTNLHHLLGFYISIPLAVVSFTGVYLGFPQTARQLTSVIAEMTPQRQRPGFGTIAGDAKLTPEHALSAALASEPPARAAALFLPTASARAPGGASARGGKDRGEASGDSGPLWRVQVRRPDGGEVFTVMVDDRSGAAERLPDPLAGDRVAQWMRWIHEGSHVNPVWQLIVFLTGVFPPVFVVTGVTMWWRGRCRRRFVATRTGRAGDLQAAE